MKFVEENESCPACSHDMRGEPIPKSSRKHYGGTTHYSLWIGIEDPLKYDGVSYWYCPFCKSKWDRFNGERVIE